MATLGGIRHLSLARPHHLQLLRQLLHLYFQGGISFIYFHLYLLCLENIQHQLAKEVNSQSMFLKIIFKDWFHIVIFEH